MNDSENNAPGPEVLREEMINIVVGDGEGRIGRHAAGNIVDNILQKQMAFYAQMAEVEADVSGPEAAMAIAELPGRADAVIKQGAEYVQFMSAEKRTAWQGATERLRETCRKLVDLL